MVTTDNSIKKSPMFMWGEGSDESAVVSSSPSLSGGADEKSVGVSPGSVKPVRTRGGGHRDGEETKPWKTVPASLRGDVLKPKLKLDSPVPGSKLSAPVIPSDEASPAVSGDSVQGEPTAVKVTSQQPSVASSDAKQDTTQEPKSDTKSDTKSDIEPTKSDIKPEVSPERERAAVAITDSLRSNVSPEAGSANSGAGKGVQPESTPSPTQPAKTQPTTTEVPGAVNEVRREVGEPDDAEDPHNGVSDDEYAAAKRRVDAGGTDDKDYAAMYRYENPMPKEPEPVKLDEYDDIPFPAMQRIDSNYRNVYAVLQEEIRKYGDDPESVAKREKSRKAAKLIAALGDVMQAALNMWSVYGGGKSAKLSSLTGAVGSRIASEDKARLLREEKRAKRLADAVKLDGDAEKELNRSLRAIWLEARRADRSKVDSLNRSKLAEYRSRWVSYGRSLDAWNRGLNNAMNHGNRMKEAKTKNAYAHSQISARAKNQSSQSAQNHRQRMVEIGERERVKSKQADPSDN